jgi:kynurenine formamidase
MELLSALLDGLAAGRVELLDLTAPLGPDTPILQLPAPFANTIPAGLERISDFDAAGPAWSWNNLHTGEHTGTHLDAPIHWVTGREGRSVAEIEPSRLVGPVVVVDHVADVEANPDFLLEPHHLEQWQEHNGAFTDNTWIVFRTGWGSRSRDAKAFANVDDSGSHTPGVSAAGARWLSEHPAVSGFGVETVGIDAGAAGGLEPPFPAHYFLLGADKYGLTQLQNVERLPVTGAVLIVAPLPIVGGTGSPARVYALIPAP